MASLHLVWVFVLACMSAGAWAAEDGAEEGVIRAIDLPLEDLRIICEGIAKGEPKAGAYRSNYFACHFYLRGVIFTHFAAGTSYRYTLRYHDPELKPIPSVGACMPQTAIGTALRVQVLIEDVAAYLLSLSEEHGAYYPVFLIGNYLADRFGALDTCKPDGTQPDP